MEIEESQKPVFSSKLSMFLLPLGQIWKMMAHLQNQNCRERCI